MSQVRRAWPYCFSIFARNSRRVVLSVVLPALAFETGRRHRYAAASRTVVPG